MTANVWMIAFSCFVVSGQMARPQDGPNSLGHISHSSTVTVMKQDGTCIDAPISAADDSTITLQPYGKSPVAIPRTDIVQISQGDALLFSAVSSWTNVKQTPVYPREALLLKLSNGKVIQGKPTKVTADGITLKHGLITTDYKKVDVVVVDYLRLKPESDGFDYFAQEAPGLLFFYPEFYSRLIGLEGRIPVRLYDGAKPEAPGPPRCLRR